MRLLKIKSDTVTSWQRRKTKVEQLVLQLNRSDQKNHKSIFWHILVTHQVMLKKHRFMDWTQQQRQAS